jgi:hypothetical protein
MGLDHEANRKARTQSRKRSQRRLWNEWCKLIERRRAIAQRLKQIDTVLRNRDSPEGKRDAAC